jgi:hypothetical protein
VVSYNLIKCVNLCRKLHKLPEDAVGVVEGLEKSFRFQGLFPVKQYCYSEDGNVVLGRVLVFHGIKFTAMFWEIVLLTYSDCTTAFYSIRLDGPGVGLEAREDCL